VTSCNSQIKTKSGKEEINTPNQLLNNTSQIGEYITETFEDSKGNLWFSTLSKSVAKYDGIKLIYNTTIGSRVGSIVEDSNANLWFGTHSGVYKYDGESFTHFTKKDRLAPYRMLGTVQDITERKNMKTNCIN